MTKIQLLYNRDEHASFTNVNSGLGQYLQQYFDFTEFDPAAQYDIKNTVLMVLSQNHNLWWKPPVEQGFKMIIDNLSEVPEAIQTWWIATSDSRVLAHKPVPESSMILQSPNFFRYCDALGWQQFDYDQYRPNRQMIYKALVLMGRKKNHRTQLVDKLGKQLDQCVWSYVEQGKQLNHADVSVESFPNWTRYLNPDWFDQCCFSIVAESLAEPPVGRLPFITEKTWKCVAMQHPFMTVGEPGTLQHLHSLGFETFENLWSESYDMIQSTSDRIDQVVKNVVQYNMEPLDQLTLQKLEHNRNHFFNRDVIRQGILNDIVNPILEYVSK